MTFARFNEYSNSQAGFSMTVFVRKLLSIDTSSFPCSVISTQNHSEERITIKLISGHIICFYLDIRILNFGV